MSDTYAPPPPPPSPQPIAPKAGNGLATAGFVVALLGFLGSFIPVINIGGIVLGVVGAVLAVVGLVKSRTTGSGKGLAIAGLVLGALAVVVGIVVNVAFVSAVDDALNEATGTTVETPATTTDDTAPAADDDADEAAPAELGTSRDNPAPLGSAVTGGDWTVTINSVTPVEADSLGQTAAPGSALIAVNLTATYNGDDPQGATSWATVKLVTADGTTIDGLDGSTVFISENPFDSLSTVYGGGTVTGDQLLEVPAEWQSGVLAVSPDIASNDTFVAVQ
ncbi:hypothetical protein [Cellulomonas iranensis]|uniref:hypothetical protein n=1 Tax=Cellulomonas iranensis TaxID=76862 RepID=UPI000B3CB80B|nr:hypothetical protein [Cellulomonas iranensis]